MQEDLTLILNKMDEKINVKLEELLSSTDEKIIITLCMFGKDILIGDNQWFRRNENPAIYDSILAKYNGRISHGLCQKHSKEYYDI